MRRILSIVLLLPQLLAACSKGNDTLSKAEAADRYQELVEPHNQALYDLVTVLNADPPYVPAIHDAAVALVDTSESFDHAAEKTQWPRLVRDDVSFLVSSDERALEGLRALENVETTEDLVDWSQEWGEKIQNAFSDTRGASDAVRTKLGLPPLSPVSPS